MKYLTILLFALSFSVLASGNPHHEDDIYYYGDTNEDVVPDITYGDTKGVASAIAQAQCDVDRSTYKVQGCFSLGRFDFNTAVNASFGIRLNERGDLYKFSISLEGDGLGFGMGYNFKF